MKKRLVALLLAVVMISLTCCVAMAGTIVWGDYKVDGPRIIRKCYEESPGWSSRLLREAIASITLNGHAYSYNNPQIVYSGKDIKVGASFNNDWMREDLPQKISTSGDPDGEVGNHSAFFTVVGTGVIARLDFTIVKATPSLDYWPNASDITLGQKLGDSVLSDGGVRGVPGEGYISGKFVWDNPDYVPQKAGKYAYPITFIPDDSKNYNSISCGSVIVKVVEPQELEVPFADVAEQEAEIKVPFETQTEQSSVLPVEEHKPAEEAAPAEEVKPAEETKPVEEVKPEEAAKPVEEAA